MKLNQILGITSLLALASLPFLAACSDDSSSVASGEKYILDEANQKFALIYDRCYTSENTTRWDEYVDTTWFHYKFIGDTLVVIKDGNTADGSSNDDEEYNRDEGEVYVGGSESSIFGSWKTTKERCYYEDGEIDCEDDEDGSSNEAIFTLDISKNNLTMSWELEKSYCPAEELEFKLEEVVLYDIDEADYSITRSGCNTVKFKVNGKSVTATATASISKDNVATFEHTYSSGDKTCHYVFKKVHKLLQIPESLCNADDMSKYMKKEPGYPHKYQVNNEDEFIPCLSEMLGMEVEY